MDKNEEILNTLCKYILPKETYLDKDGSVFIEKCSTCNENCIDGNFCENCGQKLFHISDNNNISYEKIYENLTDEQFSRAIYNFIVPTKTYHERIVYSYQEKCSSCRSSVHQHQNYCKNCGAKLKHAKNEQFEKWRENFNGK